MKGNFVATTIDAPARVLLTPSFCQDLIVSSAPFPNKFNGNPNENLFSLGVVDDVQGAQHKARIQSALHKDGFSIAQADIQTGPGVTVGTCSLSVLSHAH